MATNHRESSSLLIKVTEGSMCEEEPRLIQPVPSMTEEEVIEKAFQFQKVLEDLMDQFPPMFHSQLL